MKRRYAALLPFVLLLSTSPASAATGDLGHDISYPNCISGGPTTNTPGTGVFGVVGVIEGKPWDPVNPCLQDQVTWAAGLARAPMLYVNSANPGPASVHWDNPATTSPVPCVNAASASDPACAYGYGWDAAEDALAKASTVSEGAAFVAGLTWWIDVEILNSWVGDGISNAADLQGMVDYLRSAGVPDVGVYSSARATSPEWQEITGSAALGTSAYTRATSALYRSHWPFVPKYPIEDGPVWFPGAGTSSDAQVKCGGTSFTGGERLLAQYGDGGYDGDYRCADADHSAPTATMTLPASFVNTTPQVVPGWTGTDTGSGLASFDLQTIKAPANGSFGPWSILARRLTTTTFSVSSAARGTTACWAVRSRDAAGNTSALSASRCAATPFDERDLTASTGWTTTTGAAGWFTGSYRSTTRLGATLTRTGLQTKHLVLLAYRCPTCGAVSVLLNGGLLKTVSLASSASGRVQITLPAFTYRAATVTLRVATSGKLVRLDGLATSRV
ncbi:MAG: hypothetical protein M3P04_08100 [Actinomycetota bacterium]|nr:hypothetical protein [Actinomycetota bacterium]